MARKLKTVQEEPMKQDEAVAPTNFAEVMDDATYHRSRCGGALRQARETQGLSVQDVASKLRLGLKQIDAIEADQFEKLPEPTIVRGFIRNYAKLLKINSEPLLDAYTVIVPSNMQHELTVKPTSNMLVTSGDRPKSSRYVLAGLVALLALGAWLFYQNYIQKPSPTNPSTNIESSSNEVMESLPQPALPAAERTPPETTTLTPSTELTLPPAATDSTPSAAPVESQTVPVVTTPAVTTSAVTTSAVTTPATALPNTVPAPALPVASVPVAAPTTAPASTLAPAQKSLVKLEFIATQETWVSVVDADGKTIYDKIIFAGSRESIEAKQPLNVVVGNAGATSLNVNGKSVELGPHSRNNVARIKLE